jgi:hypothetical protein
MDRYYRSICSSDQSNWSPRASGNAICLALPSPRGDNSKRVKIHWKFLKIFFFRTSKPISVKLGTNHPWVKGILNCSNKGPDPFQKGDNYLNAKMGWGHLKILSRTTEPE